MTGDTYMVPRVGWVCFHCGEHFTTPGSARDHFGASQGATPGCQIKVGEERGLLMALRKAEDQIEQLRAQNAELDNDAGAYHGMVAELERRFNGARTLHQAGLELEELKNRADALLLAIEFAVSLEAEGITFLTAWNVGDAGEWPEFDRFCLEREAKK